jgi:hypothetical protein
VSFAIFCPHIAAYYSNGMRSCAVCARRLKREKLRYDEETKRFLCKHCAKKDGRA